MRPPMTDNFMSLLFPETKVLFRQRADRRIPRCQDSKGPGRFLCDLQAICQIIQEPVRSRIGWSTSRQGASSHASPPGNDGGLGCHTYGAIVISSVRPRGEDFMHSMHKRLAVFLIGLATSVAGQ